MEPLPPPGAASLAEASRALAEGRHAEAKALAERALEGELDRDVPPVERGEHYDLPERALAHHIVGTARLELGDRAGAIASLTKAVALDPNSAVSFSNRAVAKRDSEDLEGALADFSQALVVRPRYVHALYNRARLFVRMGRADRGELDYLAILRIEPRAEPSLSEWRALRSEHGQPSDDAALEACLARGR